MSGVVGRRAEETELDGLGKLSFLCGADADENSPIVLVFDILMALTV